MSTGARALHLVGGLHHPADATAAFWSSLWSRLDIEARTFEDIDEGCRDLQSRPCDLLVVSALRWPMDNDPKYEPHRERWAFRVGEGVRSAVEGHLARGGAVLGMHAASISFTDWPQWPRILGGAWVWGRSGHPPFGPVQVRVDDPRHPVTQGVSGFDLHDEVYGGLDIDADCQVLMHARAAHGAWMPCLWTHSYGSSRVCYDALGHDAGSLGHPAHQQLIEQAVRWLLEPAAGNRHP